LIWNKQFISFFIIIVFNYNFFKNYKFIYLFIYFFLKKNILSLNLRYIQIVESNEQKFNNITPAEIQKRKQFVSYARNTIMVKNKKK